jgi:hypothetical protein
VSVHDVGVWHLLDLATILEHGQLLELLDGRGGTELLPHEERVIFLRELETKCWVSYDDANGDETEEEHDNSGPLVLEMHSRVRIRQLIVHVLVLESNTMHIVVLEIVENSEVVMNIASSIKILWEKVEPDIIPVRWLDLICGGLRMSEVFSERELGDLGIEESHLSLEELILTSIVVGVLISHAQSGGK